MAEIRIVCIRKAAGNHINSYEGITAYGYKDYRTGKTNVFERASMVKWVENNNQTYVRDTEGNKVYCMIRQTDGDKFLQTVADGKLTDNLLSLPECS